MSEDSPQHGAEDAPRLSLEERTERCPIHNWRDIDAHMDAAGVPEHLRPLLQELLVARGEYSVEISTEDAKAFARTAEMIVFASGVEPTDGRALYYIFGDIVGQWMRDARTPHPKE